nr:PhzF family phenazine biosynthesis protein [uncultured Vibrio sp.]
MTIDTTLAIEHDINVYLVNSFTKGGLGGNPAGVVLGPPSLSTEQKTYIARQVGFSETAFVYTNKETDFKVEFFTAEGEVDFCGHATLAAFFVLASQGFIERGCYTQQTKAGILHVAIDDSSIVMDQTKPLFRRAPHVKDIAYAIGISSDVITSTGLPIEIISTGLPDIIVPVQTGHLDILKPNFAAISKLSQEFNTIGFHVFELSNDKATIAHCRNFAPLYGINEESATGSASGALGCYLIKHDITDSLTFALEQGRSMGALSLIQVTIDSKQGIIRRVRVGGQASLEGMKEVPISLSHIEDLRLCKVWNRYFSVCPMPSKA